MKWIDVNDNLPERWTIVLVVVRQLGYRDVVNLAYYNETALKPYWDLWTLLAKQLVYTDDYEITHWMPIERLID
jgi:hypothetical protein